MTEERSNMHHPDGASIQSAIARLHGAHLETGQVRNILSQQRLIARKCLKRDACGSSVGSSGHPSLRPCRAPAWCALGERVLGVVGRDRGEDFHHGPYDGWVLWETRARPCSMSKTYPPAALVSKVSLWRGPATSSSGLPWPPNRELDPRLPATPAFGKLRAWT